MKLTTFEYVNSKGEKSSREVLSFVSDSNYLEGIDIQYLSDKEKEDLKEVLSEFESKLKPFMKGWRKFFKKEILKEEKIPFN